MIRPVAAALAATAGAAALIQFVILPFVLGTAEQLFEAIRRRRRGTETA